MLIYKVKAYTNRVVGAISVDGRLLKLDTSDPSCRPKPRRYSGMLLTDATVAHLTQADASHAHMFQGPRARIDKLHTCIAKM